MNRQLKKVKYFVIILLLVLLSSSISAQPPEGYEWPQRALDYAFYWWDTNYPDQPWFFNPDYGYIDLGNDCANFLSQVGQPGCIGLCEYNNNNNVVYPEHNWTSRANCPWWIADVSGPYWNPFYCIMADQPDPPPLMHFVVSYESYGSVGS